MYEQGARTIERAIAELLDREPDNTFTTEELCEKIYRTKHVERKHRIAVVQAAASFAKRRDTLHIWKSRNLGTHQDLSNYRDNVMSYGMARLRR